MVYRRDPLSVRFDLPARRLVERAYERKGEWVYGFLPPPGPKARAWMASQGINPYERDRWGELRYIRAFKRACFWLLNNYGRAGKLGTTKNLGAGTGGWHSPVRGEWLTGIRVRDENDPNFGKWAVRFRIHAGGKTTSKIGRENALRRGDNWIDEDGVPTFRQSTPADRPWEEYEEDILPPAWQARPESEIVEEANQAAAYRAYLLRRRLGLE